MGNAETGQQKGSEKDAETQAPYYAAVGGSNSGSAQLIDVALAMRPPYPLLARTGGLGHNQSRRMAWREISGRLCQAPVAASNLSPTQ
jgi:hypothetical protein